MATKKGRSADRIGFLGAGRAVSAGDEPYATLVHADHPGLAFTLAFDDRGEVKRFEVARWEARLPKRLDEIARAWSAAAPQTFSAAEVRSIRFGELLAYARRSVLAPAHVSLTEIIDGADALHWAKVFSERPGRGGRTDLALALVAEAYVELLTEERTVPALAQRFSASEKTIKNQLLAARQRHLLTHPPKQGRKGGRLTKYAERVLADARAKEIDGGAH
jgi:hypothetical protein